MEVVTTHMEDLDLFLDDKIDEAEYLKRTSGLSDDEKKKLEDRIKAESSTTLSDIAKAKALRKEKARVEALAAGEGNKPTNTGDKFREEQKTKAFNKLKSEFGIEDKDFDSYKEGFKKFDEGHVDSELIFENLKSFYAYKNPNELLDARSKILKFKENADDFMADMAGGNGGGSGSGEGDENKKKYLPETHALVKKAKAEGTTLSLDQAQKILTQGFSRTY